MTEYRSRIVASRDGGNIHWWVERKGKWFWHQIAPSKFVSPTFIPHSATPRESKDVLIATAQLQADQKIAAIKLVRGEDVKR